MVKKCYQLESPVWAAPGMKLALSVPLVFVCFASDAYRTVILPTSRRTQQEANMFPIIRAHWDARKLSRELRKSLASLEDDWKVGTDETGHPTLSADGFRIVLMPRAARLFDAIHVYSNDAKIWLPLLARLRLRAAARGRLIQDASEHWHGSELTKTRARRRRSEPAA
jgi:hypothetical protein